MHSAPLSSFSTDKTGISPHHNLRFAFGKLCARKAGCLPRNGNGFWCERCAVRYSKSDTADMLSHFGLTVSQVLSDNDAYHALQKTDGLIFTGPTGTNVNDIAIGLIG